MKFAHFDSTFSSSVFFLFLCPYYLHGASPIAAYPSPRHLPSPWVIIPYFAKLIRTFSWYWMFICIHTEYICVFVVWTTARITAYSSWYQLSEYYTAQVFNIVFLYLSFFIWMPFVPVWGGISIFRPDMWGAYGACDAWTVLIWSVGGCCRHNCYAYMTVKKWWDALCRMLNISHSSQLSNRQRSLVNLPCEHKRAYLLLYTR